LLHVQKNEIVMTPFAY